MTYDLSFFSDKPKTLDFVEKVKSYFEAFPNFTIFSEADKMVFDYVNPNTGVYFTVEFDESMVGKEQGIVEDEDLDEDDEEMMNDPRIHLKSYSAGLSCTINYSRPNFFAYEVMPIIVNLQDEFDLLIFNPQLDDIECFKKYSKDDLIQSWINSNIRTSQMNYYLSQALPEAETQLIYISEEESTEAWQYLYAKPYLENTLDKNYYVPSLMLFFDPTQNKLLRIVPLQAGEKVVVPKCDYVFLEQYESREEGKKVNATDQSQIAMLSYEEFLSIVKDFLISYDHVVPHLNLLDRVDDETFYKINNDTLPRFSAFVDMIKRNNITGIKPDAYTNVKFGD